MTERALTRVAKRGPARRPAKRPPAPTPEQVAAARERNRWIVIGTLLLTFLAYAPSLANGFVDFDDPENVIDNYAIRDLNATNLGHFFSAPLQYMYTPLVYLSYAVDFAIGELDPTAYHVTNLLLHLANTAAVFGVFYALTRRAFVSGFVTAAFAIHPMNVDGVAWISTRSGLLAALFTLLALYAYIRYVDGGGLRYLIGSAVLFLFATFSKSPAVVLPLVLFLVDYYRRRLSWRMPLDLFRSAPWPAASGLTSEERARREDVASRATGPARAERAQRGTDPGPRRVAWRRLVVEKMPFLAIALTMGIVALRFRVDTVNPYDYSIVDRFFVACSALVAYVFKLFVPFGLSFAHAYPPKNGAFLPWYVYVSPVLLGVGAWLLLRMRRSRRIVVFGLSFFLITIVLSQAVLLVDNFQANRYAYLPYLGLFGILGHFVDRLVNGKAVRARLDRVQTAGVAALVVVAMLFSSLTFVRGRVWHDTITLMSNSIENEPGVAFVYNSRGIARYKAGDHAGARVDFEKTIALDPDFYLSYYYLGLMKYLAGDYAGALADQDRAVGLNSLFAAGYNERGKARQKLNDLDGARLDFSSAIALDAYLPDAYYNRGVVELERNNHQAAVADFDRAIDLFGDFADAYHRRGLARSRLGDQAGACADWDRARSLGSSEASQAYTESCPPR